MVLPVKKCYAPLKVGELIIRSSKLFPASRQANSASVATAFIFEPNDKQQQIGELFVVIEILSAANKPEKVADLIIEAFGKAFYAPKDDDEEDGEGETAARFDVAIKAVNQDLAHYTGHEDATWIGKTSAILAVAKENELHITSTGSAEAYLARKGHLAKIDATDHEHRHQTHKPFTNIASGHLESGDRLLFSTPALLRILSRKEITDILSDSNANAAAAEIAERIEPETGSERVAAIIAEATTSEAISGEPLPTESPSIALGPKGRRFDSIKAKATPLLQNASTHARPLAGKSAELAQRSWHYTKSNLGPKARQHGLSFVGWLRRKLRNPKQRKFVFVGVIVVALALFFIIFSMLGSGSKSAEFKIYDQALSEAQSGQQLWLSGNKTSAQSKLQAASSDLSKLARYKPAKSFDKALSKRKHSGFDPASVGGLKNLIQNLLDQITGLTRTSGKPIATLSGVSDPTFLEVIAKNLVVVSSDSSPSITTVTTDTHKVSTKSVKQVGKVVATAVGDDSVYLLTDKPDVWAFKPSDGSLTELSASWVNGKAIATYNGNIYILRDDNSQVMKFAKTGSDFSDPTTYLASGQESNLTGMNALFVDGSVITAGNGIDRFFTGSLAQQAKNLPSDFKNISEVKTFSNGNLILALDQAGHLGTLNFDGGSITFSKQFLVSGETLGAFSSGDATTIYGLSGNKVFSFSLSP